MLVFAYLLILLIHLKELLNFDEVHCFFPFKDYVFGVISQKSLPNPRSQRCSHVFS